MSDCLYLLRTAVLLEVMRRLPCTFTLEVLRLWLQACQLSQTYSHESAFMQAVFLGPNMMGSGTRLTHSHNTSVLSARPIH